MRKINLKIRAVVCILMMILAGQVVAETHYVSPGPSIQKAIDDAKDGDEIEVSSGKYNEAIDFKGKAVRLYSSGGPEVTTINAHGIAGAYHVIQCISGEGTNTVLNGFTLTGGNANGASYPDNCGGGMYNFGSSPTVVNCRLTFNNAAYYGGGMENDTSSPTVSNCTFSNNEAIDGGGGMSNYSSSSPTVTNCTFSDNSASGSGGGIYNYNSNPTVANCTFIFNNATYYGGGMENHTSSPTVTNCTFSDNEAIDGGGGMSNYSSSSPEVTNCTFISNNSDFGGGMYNVTYANPTVTNCTFNDNAASGSGGGICNETTSSPILTNCILWHNTPDNIYDDLSGSTLVTYSDIEDGTGEGWFGIGCIDADPLFVSAAGGDLRLSSYASPCVDTGDNGAPGLPATDLAGNPRVVDGDGDGSPIVDMGAFEVGPVKNINQNRFYSVIQNAIDDSNNGDEIEVRPGIYNEAINFKGKAIRLYSSGGPEVTTINGNGAYHTVQCVSGEDVNTILEGFTITGGNANGSGYNEDRGGGMYNYRISPTVGSSPTVVNCIFRGNTASYLGGGMYNCNRSSPIVKNCNFISNNAVSGGGGMYNEQYANPKVINCSFIGNSSVSDGYGGGIYGGGEAMVVNNCIFSGNSAYSGGGMSIKTATVTNCTFINNTAVLSRGGGMSIGGQSSATVANCTFISNQASSFGGGMYNYNDSSPTVSNCTFRGNVAEGGGGISNYDGNPTLTNCILWSDTPDEIYDFLPSITTVTYSDVEGGWAGTSNIDADPRFVDVSNPDPNLWNLRLKPDSPCIDRGDSTALSILSAFLDLDGNFRFFDVFTIPNTGSGLLKFLDMGAYEYYCKDIAGDINCDGVVDFKDIAIVCNNWLAGTEQE